MSDTDKIQFSADTACAMHDKADALRDAFNKLDAPANQFVAAEAQIEVAAASRDLMMTVYDFLASLRIANLYPKQP